MTSFVILDVLRIEPLLILIEKCQLRGFGHLTGMPRDQLLGKVFWACPTRRRPWDIPRSCWRDCISLLVWDPLRAGRGDPGRKGLDFSAQYMCLCLDSCPTNQTQIHGRKWMDELVKNSGKMLLDLLQYSTYDITVSKFGLTILWWNILLVVQWHTMMVKDDSSLLLLKYAQAKCWIPTGIVAKDFDSGCMAKIKWHLFANKSIWN